MLINCGQYSFDLATSLPLIQKSANLIYGDAPVSGVISDFNLSLNASSLLRRFVKPQVSFLCDQHSPFKPLPLNQGYALLEWGMNWCIAAHEYTRFLIHSAVLVKNDKAILCPASPGSGKSTLSAYLGLSGWYVYSDEMAIIDMDEQRVLPMFRPVCLKNESISLLQSWHPSATVTPVCRDTQKGDVAHVKVLSWSQYQQLRPAPIAGLVFPRYKVGSDLKIYQLDQLDSFNQLSHNAFNYNVLGKSAFKAAAQIVGNAKSFEVEYSKLTDLALFFDELVQD
ncbi:HprK-related kinase A [Rheinheimera sp. UJ63]|uniref:HprK-related kinase A n=1 Tax=Rheinheimera sp. UJ63 TaxID=2910157 RepID=UPI001F316383|nr:HprK-related kinase A [Rheinheimera sp. UJ63]MCF4010256.1 HprK-related kinase A [Rheinheimera sp. UJ63]